VKLHAYAIAIAAVVVTTLVGQSLAWTLLAVAVAVVYVLCREAGEAWPK